MIDYAKCLVYLFPNAEWAINDNDYESLQWFSNEAKPTEKEIIDAWTDAKNAYEAKIANKATEKAALLERLGLTQEEFNSLRA